MHRYLFLSGDNHKLLWSTYENEVAPYLSIELNALSIPPRPKPRH